VQSDSFNRSRIGTVVVVSLTSNLGLAAAPGNILCRPRGTGLS
jgi:mRNA interferase MazF